MKLYQGKYIYLFFVFVVLYISGSLYWILTDNYIGEPTLVETQKCPVCYGDSLCHSLLKNQIKLTKTAKMKLLDIFRSNSELVHHAVLDSHTHGQTKIVLKKLGKNHDLRDLDALICSKAKMADLCDVSSAISKLSFVKQIDDGAKFAKYLQGSSLMFYCPSTRLISQLFSKYRETSTRGGVTLSDRVKIWSTAVINQEPLLLQMFPASDGWPFPEYIGACGRYVAVGNAGEPLSAYYDASWSFRADLAYQLMKLADMLTNNKADFALYLTDVDDDNFAVNADGHVTLVDLENILVVDKQAVTSAKPKGWEEFHESVYAECPGKTFKSCHSFSEVQLCSHMTSDHNYYAICRYILTRPNDKSKNGNSQKDGLLHGIPEHIYEDWDLEYLLNECVSPSRQRGRIQVVHKIIEALDDIRKL